MQDYLFNKDMAKEVIARGKDRVHNLQLLRKGLCVQVPRYDPRITTDSENKFLARFVRLDACVIVSNITVYSSLLMVVGVVSTQVVSVFGIFV